MIVLGVIVGVAILAVAVGIIYEYGVSKRMQNFERNGIIVKRIKELNETTDFKKFRGNYDRVYYRSTNPQKIADAEFAFNCFVKDVVLPQIDTFEDLLMDVKHNKKIYPIYIEQLNQLLNKTSDVAERRLCKQYILNPLLDDEIKFELYYFYYKERRCRTYIYKTADIEKAIRQAKGLSIIRQNAQYERSIMSDALRFQILKRDNYTCQICGRRAKDGVELEVDHIIPISKGGKTEPRNLQTLCKSCNRGKGTEMMFDI